MQLRTVLFCSFLALPVLAACGDDETGSGGGDSTSTGSSTSGTPASSGANNNSTSSGGDGDGDGGGGGDAATSTSSTGGGEGGGAPELSCDAYCETIMAACEEFPQYPSIESCQRSCPGFQEGVYQDADASLGCHQYHALAAEADPAFHCAHAGPQGGDQCGDGCENFCQLAVEVCPGVYADEDVCMKVCPSFDDGTFSVDPPATGDNLGCRLYHLTVAALSDDDAGIHCPHTAADSDQCF